MVQNFGSVKSLHIYPIKSCQGIEFEELRIDELGPFLDRRWMVVNDDGVFQTQRQIPKIATLSTQMTDTKLVISSPEGESHAVDRQICEQGTETICRVWKDEVKARSCGEGVDRWLSEYLGRPLKLVFMSTKSPRVRDKSGKFKIGFADSRPFLLTSTASLEDLNKRMGTPIPMNRFRANIVIDSATPFEEDTWPDVKIGEIEFRHSVACDRCVIPTIDQTSGQRMGAEPLKTLKTYRAPDGVVLFGRRLVHRNSGVIRIGDRVEQV